MYEFWYSSGFACVFCFEIACAQCCLGRDWLLTHLRVFVFPWPFRWISHISRLEIKFLESEWFYFSHLQSAHNDWSARRKILNILSPCSSSTLCKELETMVCRVKNWRQAASICSAYWLCTFGSSKSWSACRGMLWMLARCKDFSRFWHQIQMQQLPKGLSVLWLVFWGVHWKSHARLCPATADSAEAVEILADSMCESAELISTATEQVFIYDMRAVEAARVPGSATTLVQGIQKQDTRGLLLDWASSLEMGSWELENRNRVTIRRWERVNGWFRGADCCSCLRAGSGW